MTSLRGYPRTLLAVAFSVAGSFTAFPFHAALAAPNLDAPLTVADGSGLAWTVYPDTETPGLFHRFPRLFAIRRDDVGRPLVHARYSETGRYEVELAWGEEAEPAALLRALRERTSSDARLKTLTASDASLDPAPELAETFEAQVEGAGTLGTFLPGIERSLVISVPPEKEKALRRVLTREGGLANLVTFTFGWEDPARGAVRRTFSTLLWLGDLRPCVLSPLSPCP